MICSYMRSSSYNNFEFCKMQYYLNYVLGIPRSVGKKADKGTMVHKILECIANIKLQEQNTNHINWLFEDECLTSPLEIHKHDILKPQELTNKEIEDINKTRINKSNYPDNCQLKPGHTRYGVQLVEKIIQNVYDYYTINTNHKWQPVDFRDITNWSWMALDYQEGNFDPRRKRIIEPEIKFNIVIEKPWAKYDFTINQKRFQGNLAVRGTIDLLTRVDEGIIEIVDWKTGQRLNWETGQRKDYKSLSKDPQLLMYYWAVKQLFPEEEVITSIFWIRDGGPYTFCFEKEHFDLAEKLMEKRFNEIKECQLPNRVDPTHNNFKCNRICDYYKIQSPDGKNNMCDFIHSSILEAGIDVVTEQYNRDTFNTYENPGEI